MPIAAPFSIFYGLSITNIGIVNAEDSKFEQTPIVAGEIEDFDLSNLKQMIKKIEKRADEKGSRGETSGGFFHIFNPGETAVGWLYHFAFDDQQQSYFTSSANSTASPFGYWSDSIYIQ